MKNFSIRLPLKKNDNNYFFDTNNTIEDHIAQLLQTIVFVTKGEYLMNYDYGIGLQKTLFENITGSIKSEIQKEIKFQIKKYIKDIIIYDIYVFDSFDYEKGINISSINEYYKKFFGTSPLKENELLVSIFYNISGRDENNPKLMSLIINNF